MREGGQRFYRAGYVVNLYAKKLRNKKEKEKQLLTTKCRFNKVDFFLCSLQRGLLCVSNWTKNWLTSISRPTVSTSLPLPILVALTDWSVGTWSVSPLRTRVWVDCCCRCCSIVLYWIFSTPKWRQSITCSACQPLVKPVLIVCLFFPCWFLFSIFFSFFYSPHCDTSCRLIRQRRKDEDWRAIPLFWKFGLFSWTFFIQKLIFFFLQSATNFCLKTKQKSIVTHFPCVWSHFDLSLCGHTQLFFGFYSVWFLKLLILLFDFLITFRTQIYMFSYRKHFCVYIFKQMCIINEQFAVIPINV